MKKPGEVDAWNNQALRHPRVEKTSIRDIKNWSLAAKLQERAHSVQWEPPFRSNVASHQWNKILSQDNALKVAS